MIHTSVMVKEVARYLIWKKNGIYVDATVGEGGHALHLLKSFPRINVIGIDRDREILKEAEKNTSRYKRITFECGNFSDVKNIIYKKGISKIEGILFDLGFSLFHIESSKRGFSFKKDEFLDMRYNRENSLSAYEIINKFSRDEIEDIFLTFGEEKKAGKIASAIVKERKKKAISTTFQLKKVIENAVKKRGKIHPATLVFQALRIAVNKELENLRKVLFIIPEILKEGGRIVIISYHSLEDRIVKRAFLSLKRKEKFLILTPKPITPTEKEILVNPHSRSAKLRAGEVI